MIKQMRSAYPIIKMQLSLFHLKAQICIKQYMNETRIWNYNKMNTIQIYNTMIPNNASNKYTQTFELVSKLSDIVHITSIIIKHAEINSKHIQIHFL